MKFDVCDKVTKEELDVEAGVKVAVAEVPVKKFWGATLYHKEDVPFSPKQLVYVHKV